MQSLYRIVAQRYHARVLCTIISGTCLLLLVFSTLWLWPVLVFGALTLVGLVDYLQPRHAIRRNYPVLAHFRFFFEYIRPEIRQYFIEADPDQLPRARAQRSIIHRRLKQALDKRPFGTQLKLYAPHYEWINHSIAPVHIESHDFRITVVGAACTRPYSASMFNISAMSFGAFSANAILALDAGVKRAACRWAPTAYRRRGTRPSPRRSNCANSRAASWSASSSRSAIPGNGSPSSRPCRKPASRTNSQWSTATKVAPAPHRRSSQTTSARRKFRSAGHHAEPARIKNAFNPRC